MPTRDQPGNLVINEGATLRAFLLFTHLPARLLLLLLLFLLLLFLLFVVRVTTPVHAQESALVFVLLVVLGINESSE